VLPPVRVVWGAVTVSGLVTELVLMRTPQIKKAGPFSVKIGPAGGLL
jgi:hypothetical protein